MAMKQRENASSNNMRPVKFRKVKKRPCSLCTARVEELDYKEVNTLKRYITERGKIGPRRATGLCPIHQRAVAHAIKRAREVALVPHVLD